MPEQFLMYFTPKEGLETYVLVGGPDEDDYRCEGCAFFDKDPYCIEQDELCQLGVAPGATLHKNFRRAES